MHCRASSGAALQTMTLRELALTLGSMGALVSALCGHLDSIATAAGLPLQSHDVVRQVMNIMGQAQHRD